MRRNGLLQCVWAGLLVGLLTGPPAATAQTIGQQALALAAQTRRAADQRRFDQATLPLYRRALRLATQARNDTLRAQQSYYVGRAYYITARLDSAGTLLRQGERLGLAAHDTALAARAANYLTMVYGQMARPDSLQAVLRRVQAWYPRARPGTAARNELDNILAGYYQDEGQYARSMRHRLAQLAYHRQQADHTRIGVDLSNIGELFFLQNQLRPALRYKLEGLRLLEVDPAMRGNLPQLHSMLGSTYRALGRLDSARLHYEAALRLLDRSGATDEPGRAAALHGELGTLLGQMGQLALARRHYRQALALAAASDVSAQVVTNYFAGEIELRAGNYPAARHYLRRSYALARQSQNFDQLTTIGQPLARAEAAAGHYEAAYHVRDSTAQLIDSAHAVAGQQAMAAMEARYQNQDKQRQIQLLDRESRLRAAEAASQRRAKYLAWGGVAVLLLGLGVIGYLLRQRQRTAALLARQNADLAALNQRLHGSNAQLAEANQTKAKLFSVISHDLRAPVGTLHQLLEVAEEAPDLLDPATQQQQTTHLRRTTGALLDTLDELLAWSKDQLDHLDPVVETVTLAPLLAELAALYQPLAQRKGVALAVDCPSDLAAHTDPNFLRVALRNLVQNALKFTPAGGQVRLSAAAVGPGITLRVADTGPGLTPGQLARALGTAPAAPPHDPAHGLGLQLTREFVAKLGGEFRVVSEPGAGSTFGVELPG